MTIFKYGYADSQFQLSADSYVSDSSLTSKLIAFDFQCNTDP